MTQANEKIHAPVESLLADVPAVLKTTGWSRSTLDRMRAAGKFPPPVVLGERKLYWRWADLAKWAQELPTAHVA